MPAASIFALLDAFEQGHATPAQAQAATEQKTFSEVVATWAGLWEGDEF